LRAALGWVAAVGLFALVAWPAWGGTVRTLGDRYDAEGVAKLVVEVATGELRITGGAGERVLAEAEVSCSFWRGEGCKKLAEGFVLEPVRKDGVLLLKLRGPKDENLSGVSASLRLEVPAGLSLAAEVGVGKVRVTGMSKDLDLEVGVGQVEILMKEQDVGRVDLNSGVGDVELLVRNRDIEEEGLGPLGRNLTWEEGPGKARLRVHCGVGGVQVSLD
jgi:hypothetical protein